MPILQSATDRRRQPLISSVVFLPSPSVMSTKADSNAGKASTTETEPEPGPESSPSPPPSYTPLAAQGQSSSYSAPVQAQAPPFAAPHLPLPSHVYGPTPIPNAVAQEGLLPYYDPQSEHARRQAVLRARWRFVKAFAWAVAIWVLFGIVTGGIVVDVRMRSTSASV